MTIARPSPGSRAHRTTPRQAALWRVTAAAALLALLPELGRAQWSAGGSAVGGRMEHRVDAGYGVAASAGTVVGAAGVLRAWDVLELDVHAIGGRLQGDTAARGDRRVGEVGARGNMLALPWLAFGGTAVLRGYDAVPAAQRWTMLGAGAEVRLDFAGGFARSVIRTTLLPYVRVSGQTAPDLGVATSAGLRVGRGKLSAGLDYALERYAFPADPVAGTRREQLSSLLLSIGGRW